jgi:hypothetical protein
MTVSAHKATIGRKVWVWVENMISYNIEDNTQAVDGTVVYVHEDDTVNVLAFDHLGQQIFFENLEVHDPNEDCHGSGEEGEQDYATWMPYQKKQMDSQSTSTGDANAKA